MPEVQYSIIEGPTVWPGPENLNADPRFVAAGDYRPGSGSPAIDRVPWMAEVPHDILGALRRCGGGADMGAYEEVEDCRPPETRFQRGDVNLDGATQISDPIVILGYLFGGDPKSLSCMKSADANDSGGVDLADAVWLLSYLFADGPAPPQPFPGCGTDPTPDGLGCAAFPLCP